HHQNRGQDIIDNVHSQLWNAILKPDSADGKGLRKAFIPRLSYRVKDAIASAAAKNKEEGSAAVLGSLPAVDHTEALIDVESILEKIENPKKRLAFRLHMDGLPARSKKGDSIARALGVSEKTAREWIKEATELLSSLPEVQELKSRKGGQP